MLMTKVGNKCLKTQFNLNMSWYDFRVELWNMKNNIDLNTLTKEEKKSIWVPVLEFREVLFCFY